MNQSIHLLHPCNHLLPVLIPSLRLENQLSLDLVCSSDPISHSVVLCICLLTQIISLAPAHIVSIELLWLQPLSTPPLLKLAHVLQLFQVFCVFPLRVYHSTTIPEWTDAFSGSHLSMHHLLAIAWLWKTLSRHQHNHYYFLCLGHNSLLYDVEMIKDLPLQDYSEH